MAQIEAAERRIYVYQITVIDTSCNAKNAVYAENTELLTLVYKMDCRNNTFAHDDFNEKFDSDCFVAGGRLESKQG